MTLKARPGCEQQSMLVKIIQPGEVDKDFPRSTKVWFEGVNRIHSILTRPLYTSDANALHGAAKSVDKCDPHPYGRYA